MKNKVLILYLLVLTLVSLNFFYAQFLPDVAKIFRVIIVGSSVIIGLRFSLSFGKEGLIIPIQIIIISMLISVIVSYLTWNQPMQYGLLITIPYLLWPIFFLLLYFKVPIKTVENIILAFGFIYVFLYFVQFSMPNNVLFFDAPKEEFKERRGIIRVLFPGTGIFFLAVFISISKLTSQNRNLLIWGLMAFLGILVPFMQVTRYFIVVMVVVYFYHFSFNLSFYKKMLVIFCIAIGGFYLLDLDLPIIEGLLEQQEQNMSDGTKDIRVIAFNYYLFEFPPTAINYILGNGMEHGRSEYGVFVQRLKDFGLFTSDIGIFGFYVYFGIFPIIAWGILWFKVFTLKLPKEYVYIKYYMFFMLVGIFTSHSLYSVNFLIATVFCLYICQKLIFKKKAKNVALFLLKKILKEAENEEDNFKNKKILSSNSQ
jgi:hypothetical protein